MNRREFFKRAGLAIGGIALEEAIPFGRVWSFPSTIVIAKQTAFLDPLFISREALRILHDNLKLTTFMNEKYESAISRSPLRIAVRPAQR
jgi:hypothetical protein